MKKIIVIQTIDMSTENRMQCYFDKAVEIIKEKKGELEVINLPVRYDSNTILEQIMAFKLINFDEEVQLIIAIGDLAGFAGKNKKLVLYEKNFVESFEKTTAGYLMQALTDMRENSEFSYCMEDTPLEKWSSVIETIMEEKE